MNMLKTCLPLACTLVLLSCGQPNNMAHHEEAVTTEDTTTSMPVATNAEMEMDASAPVSSNAAIEVRKDDGRKFVRTAELKFKVKDAASATGNIEDIASKEGGFVTYTELKSETDHTTTTAVSADSSAVTTYYTVVNEMTLRVPNIRLDTTLKQIAQNIAYLDSRVVKADDVALQMLSAELQQKRLANSRQRVATAIDHRGKKLGEITTAEEALLQKQAEADDAKMTSLSLTDQVNYSTISLHLYQPNTVKQEMVANEVTVTPYEPPFGSKLLKAVATGWQIISYIVLGIVNMWSIILLVLISIVIGRRYLRREKLVQEAEKARQVVQ